MPQKEIQEETPNAHAVGLSVGISKRDDTLPVEAVASPQSEIDPVLSNPVCLP